MDAGLVRFCRFGGPDRDGLWEPMGAQISREPLDQVWKAAPGRGCQVEKPDPAGIPTDDLTAPARVAGLDG